MVADEADALAGERVGARVAVHLGYGEALALFEPLEHAQEARRRLPGTFKEPHGGLVGALLLRAAVTQK